MPERIRRHPRVSVEFSAQVKPVNRVMSTADICDLSEGGAFLATEQILTVGTSLVISLQINFEGNEKACFLTGTVMWVGKYQKTGPKGCGVAFQNCNGSTAEFIREFVAQKLGIALSDGSDPADKKGPNRGQLRG